MKNLFCVASSMTLLLCASAPAFAQYGRNDNPNLRNFYMARQQIQILDDTPAVNDLRTNPAAAAAGGAPMPAAPQPLPRAGFNSYVSGLAGGGGGRGLPEVSNGVPKLPPAGPNLTGRSAGNPGKLTAKKATTTAPAAGKAPVAVKSYKPYATTGSAGAGGGARASTYSTTNVQGSVLHWNKRKPGY